MTSSGLHHSSQKERHAHAVRVTRRAGYASGGGVEEAKKDVHKHEDRLHPGKPKTKLKKGGKVEGKKPMERLDKKARGGAADSPEVYEKRGRQEVLHQKETYTNADSEPAPKRATGGRSPKHGGKTNIIIHAGGEPMPGAASGAPNPAALAQAKQEGAKMGAMAVIQKLKQAQSGAGAPGGAPPPMGASPGAMPPPGAPPPGGIPPMHKAGGSVENAEREAASPKRLAFMKKTDARHGSVVKVKAHTRRRGGRTNGGEC